MRILALCAAVLCVAMTSGQRVIDLTLSDSPANERGFLIATLVNTVGSADSGPVCGKVDLLTAWITCINLGWLFTTGQSTTSGFGITAPTDPAIISNLTCTGFDNTNGIKTFECTFLQPARQNCSASDSAAVTCYFSIGQIVGIAFGALIICLAIAILPFVLCCICCFICGVSSCSKASSQSTE